MQENRDTDLLVRELKEKLEWYTLQASDEEYDGKAVESILYLLDRMDPIEGEDIPRQGEARERFRKFAAGQKELLPLGEMVDLEPEEDAGRAKNSNRKNITVRMGYFAMRHKYIAAVILLVVIMAISGTARAIATGDPGFFYWLKQDDSGTIMMTSPEGLDAVTDTNERTYLDRDEMPDWTQEWLEIEEKFEMPEGYEWQYFETSETKYRRYVSGNYLDRIGKNRIFMGCWIYQDILSYHEEEFIDYIYDGCYEIAQQKMEIYSKMDKSGETNYVICFYNENYKYFIRGQDNLDELEQLVVQYWNFVKNS